MLSFIRISKGVIFHSLGNGFGSIELGIPGCTFIKVPRASIYTANIKNNICMHIDGPTYGGYCVKSEDGAGESDKSNITVSYNYCYDIGTSCVDIDGTTNPTVSNNTTGDPEIKGAGNKPDPYYRPSVLGANVVDSGTDVDLWYNDDAPDIGAYEICPDFEQWGTARNDLWRGWHLGDDIVKKGNKIGFISAGEDAWLSSPVFYMSRDTNYISYFGVG